MATFHRTPRGSAYLDISWLELSEYSHNPIPVCDECLQDMRGLKSITLIPILNQAYCPRCATSVARAIRDYGYNNSDKALASMPEDVRFVVKQLGWTDLCLSENAMADRAHFLKIYANHCANKARMSTLPPAVRAALPEKGDTHDEKQTLSLHSPREANH